MRHTVCNHIWKLKPSDFIGRPNRKGSRCPECNVRKGKTTDQFKKEVHARVGEEYKVIGDYVNTHYKIKMLHVCGNIYEVTPHHFLAGSRCPNCKSSSSESIITELLNNLGVKFETQYRNYKCKNKRPLPFDFKIVGFNQVVMIEYDGEHHFRPIDFSGKGHAKSKENLVKTQYHDRIKNQYCIDNNIPLIRIPYSEKENIEYIVINTLVYFDVMRSNDKIDIGIVERYLVKNDWNHEEYTSN